MIRDDTFVVTLRMDEVSFARLDVLRTRYFPADINSLPAHLTLFYALTDEQVSRLPAAGTGPADRSIPLKFVRPILIGHGVAIEVAGGELSNLHVRLTGVLGHGLTRQDRQTFRPHVTIQNKVTREAAMETFLAVRQSFSAWAGHGIGLDIWRYLDGRLAPQLHLSFV
jgi:2'-5' RNA ligase